MAGGPIQSPPPPPPPHKPPEPSQQHFSPIIQAKTLKRSPVGNRNNPGTQIHMDRHGPNADHTPSHAAEMAANDHPPLSPTTSLLTLSTCDRRCIVRIHRDPFRSQPTRRSSLRPDVGNTTHTTHGPTETTTNYTSSQQFTKTKKNDSILLTTPTDSTNVNIPTASQYSTATSAQHAEAKTHSARAARPIIRHNPTHRRRIVRNPAPSQNNKKVTTCDPEPRCPSSRPAIIDTTTAPTTELSSPATGTLAPNITSCPSETTMIASAFHTASNGTNTNDFINSHKNMTQSGIQPHPTINATIDPELIKVIRTSHDAIQQQIEAIQATLQTMITVLNRNSLPPQPTEPPR